MKIHRPLWAAGALLSPQQFQQQARWEAWNNQCVAQLGIVHPWGVHTLAFDAEALRLGKLKATGLRVRLADGTLIDSDCTDRLPPALELATRLPEGSSGATVVLALALEQANGGNCLLDDASPERPLRYRRDWRQVQDLYGDEQQSVAVLEHQLTLRLETDDNADYLTCPLARLQRDEQGVWSLDNSFMPPLLSISAHPGLLRQLDNLLTQLTARRQRLMSLRRESNERMADFAVADVSLFWLLNTLNSWQPILSDVLAHPARHPEQLYTVLAGLAGGLVTFSLEHDLDCIPAYRHEHPETVFVPLIRTLANLLETSLPSRVIAIPLKADGAHRWLGEISDLRLREVGTADFYLSVRCRLSAAQVQEQLPRLCKASAPAELDRLIGAALDGIPLRVLSHIPAALPVRLENQFFALDFSHILGRQALASGSCAFYVPGSLADLSLELFAVLRS